MIHDYHISGDSITVVQPLFQVEGDGSNPISPLQLKITEIPLQRAKELNKLWHSRLPKFNTGYLDTTRVNYAAEYKNRYYAVAIWGIPCSPSLPHDTWLELKRMAIAPAAPKNTASRMIKIMTHLIKKKFDQVYMLISYQDMEVHKGIIYKASNWDFGRIHKGAKSIRYYERKFKNVNNLNGTGFISKTRWQKQIREEIKTKRPTKKREPLYNQCKLWGN